jgi:hypothetical protein
MSRAAPAVARRRRRHRTRWEKVQDRLHLRGRTGQVAAGFGIAIALLLLFVAFRLSTARTQLNRARLSLVAARTAVTAKQTDRAHTDLDDATSALRAARHDATAFPMSLVNAVPLIGSPGRAAADVAGAGLHVATAGRLLADTAQTFPTTSGKTSTDAHDLSAMHNAAVGSEAPIAQATRELDTAHAELNGPRGAMLPFVSGAVGPVDKVLQDTRKQLSGASKGLDLLARLTAPDADQQLLLLSQDTLELRPTGGYIGSYGVISFLNGQVSLADYQTYEDLPEADPPMEPPDDLSAYLTGPWELSNVNWWPNFPYSAATAREMFKRQDGTTVDGVIAITENVMAKLVGIFGPIQVPGYAQPVVEKGFEDRVVYEVELKQPPDEPRKKFLQLLSQQVFDKLFHMSPDQLPKVAEALGQAATQGDIQAWFADKDQQAAVAGPVFDGSLPATKGDFLMLVDSNMSASKANRDLVRDVSYRVKQDADGHLVAHLEAVFKDQGAATSINPLYSSYLRVYVPEGSELLTPETDTLYSEGKAPDGPYDVFGAEGIVDPKGEHIFTFDYRLPDSVAPGGDYHLTWIRQAGTSSDTLTAQIGTHAVTADKSTRVLTVSRHIGKSGIRKWLHGRWVFRKLGF